MLKLNRTSVEAPECLARYNHVVKKWDNIDSGDKRQVSECLERLQAKRCAYCECALFDDDHIEHFRRKNPAYFPQLTFAWDNLFLSCNSANHCGHYKDRRSADPYDPNHLIKPDNHDSGYFLYFHSSGEVRVRSGLQGNDLHCAEETIRVFGLQHGGLNHARRQVLSRYWRENENLLDDLMSWSNVDRDDYISLEIEDGRNKPHASVIAHFLQKTH